MIYGCSKKAPLRSRIIEAPFLKQTCTIGLFSPLISGRFLSVIANFKTNTK